MVVVLGEIRKAWMPRHSFAIWYKVINQQAFLECLLHVNEKLHSIYHFLYQLYF